MMVWTWKDLSLGEAGWQRSLTEREGRKGREGEFPPLPL